MCSAAVRWRVGCESLRNATFVGAPCRDSGRVLKRCSEGVQNESMNGKACDLEPDELLGRHPGSHFVFTPHLKLREELF